MAKTKIKVDKPGHGTRRFGYGGAKVIRDAGKIPKKLNWVNEFPMFVSPSKSFEVDVVRKEYQLLLDKWLDTADSGDLNDFRRQFGIVIDENGNELLTTEWKQARQRRNL